MQNNHRTIIFAATQRSGSTMICDLFKSISLGIPKEYFLKLSKEDSYDSEAVSLFMKDIESKSLANKVSSIKIMANQIDIIDTCFNSFLTLENNVNKSFLASYYKSATWINIVRKNKLKQSLSRVVARQTKIYHSYQVKKKQQINIQSIDLKKVRRNLMKIALEESIWQDFFTKHSIKYHTIYYEDVINDNNIILELSNKLDLPCNGMLTTDYVKLIPKKKNRLYRNVLKQLTK